MNNDIKHWINNATYEELLKLWRFAEVGDPMFVGEEGAYYIKRMKELRAAPGGEEMHIAASKRIGW